VVDLDGGRIASVLAAQVRHQAEFPIATMARVLGVPVSGYYAWRSRLAYAHDTADVALLRRIRTIHAVSHGTYGAPRIHAELQTEGTTVARRWVIERTFGWMVRWRRLIRDHERDIDVSEAMIHVAMAPSSSGASLTHRHSQTGSHPHHNSPRKRERESAPRQQTDRVHNHLSLEGRAVQRPKGRVRDQHGDDIGLRHRRLGILQTDIRQQA